VKESDSEELEPDNNVREFPRRAGAEFLIANKALADGNLDEAERLASELVDRGYGHAYTLLGGVSEKRGHSDAARYPEAFFYYQQGADAVGSEESWLGIARLAYFGRGQGDSNGKDFARDLYQKVIDSGDSDLAHLMLGKMYLDGEGGPVDFDKAQHHLKIAAAGRYLWAYSYLGTLSFRRGRLLQGIFFRSKAAFLVAWTKLSGSVRFRLRQI